MLYCFTAEGVDYIGLLRTPVTLTPTNFVSCIQVVVIDDSVFEDTESLMVSISRVEQLNSAIHLSNDATTIFIIDNDSKLFIDTTLPLGRI